MSETYQGWPADVVERRARVVQMPVHDGDGHGYGGDYLLVIGDLAVNFGPRPGDVPEKLAELWNAAIAAGAVRKEG